MEIDRQQSLLDLAAAVARLVEGVAPLAPEEVPVARLAGRVLAAPVLAPVDLPTWPTSSMDGVALRAADADALPLPIVARIHAGDDPAPLPPAACAMIATGGVVPDGADAVVPIERLELDGDRLVAIAGPVVPGESVREPGADVRAGAVVLAPGMRLSPIAASAVAGVGLATAPCTRLPRAVVLTTGDELVPPGGPRRRGQVHESNSVLVAATLAALGCAVEVGPRVPDELDDAVRALRDALGRADLVVTSGGVSVGPRDVVKPALAALGVEQRFWRVSIQPGRPVWAGRDAAGRTVVGLPGNPLSALVCLHVLVRPLVAALLGERAGAAREQLVLEAPVRRLGARTRLLPMRAEGGVARAIGVEVSHQLARAAGADCLVVIPPGDGEVAAGARVEAVPLR